ncbi:MAG: hydrogenase maturation protease [Gemmatimonadetes bacterium]|nr:hydrogenase maturation protease [Gemmatimonadota bacterium]
MKRVLVIGIGNTTRRDDGAGVRVVEGLEQLCPDGWYLAVQQLTPELADYVARAEVVIFVDASVGVTETVYTPVTAAAMPSGSHIASPGVLLRLAGDVFNQVPAEAVQVAIPAVELGYGESLAPATQRRVARVVEVIGGWLAAREEDEPEP